MKSLQTSLPCALVLGILTLVLGGCNIKWEVVQDPYANYHRIQQRIQIQLNQIDANVQNGSLWGPMAQVLTENDDMIRQLAWHYQGGQAVDLTPQQAGYLDYLLNDNAAALNDALARRDQWAQAFEGGWEFSYDTFQDRLLYIAYLHYQLDRQRSMIDEAAQSGDLTSSQAQDLKTRIGVIRNSETGCYNLNGRLDLTVNQINRLQQMVDDNGRFLRFRTSRRRGRWNGDHYAGWSSQRKQYTNNPWLDNSPAVDSPSQPQNTHGRYWDGRPFHRQAAAQKPLPPAPAPTATPIPYHPAVSAPTATAVPVVAAPAATPIPIAAAPTPVPARVQSAAPTFTSVPFAFGPTRVPPAPTFTPPPTVVKAHPTPVFMGHPIHPIHPVHPVHPEHPSPAGSPLGGAFPNGSPSKASTPSPSTTPSASASTPVPQQTPASAPATLGSSAGSSGNTDQSDQSAHPQHPDHPDHPDHPGHPDNPGNDDNAQGQGN